MRDVWLGKEIMMKTGYKTNQWSRISRRLVDKARLPTERAGEVGLECGGERTCLKLRPGQCRVLGVLELLDDARRLPKGPEAPAGIGQSPSEHAGNAMLVMPWRRCHEGSATQAMPQHKDAEDTSANLVTPPWLPPESKLNTDQKWCSNEILFRETTGKPSWGLWLFNTTNWVQILRAQVLPGENGAAHLLPNAFPATAMVPSSLPAPNSLALAAASCPSSQFFDSSLFYRFIDSSEYTSCFYIMDVKLLICCE